MTKHAWAGDWALVTGASSGIGREFARQLAAAGLNLVLVARRLPLLEELSAELARLHGTRTKILAVDLSRPGAAGQVHAAVAEEGIRVRLLCNNAAAGPWGPFEQTSADEYERVMHLTAIAPVALCRLFLTDLAAFPASAIINVSSPAALQPIPNKAVYAAAKACLHQFSLALYGEWAHRGVRVQTLIPGPTQSELDGKSGAYRCAAIPDWRRPPEDVVRASLSQLMTNRPVVTTARGTYRQRVFAGLLPIKLLVRIVRRMFLPLDEPAPSVPNPASNPFISPRKV